MRRALKFDTANLPCCLLFATLTASVLLQGCIPIYYRSHEAVAMREPSAPVVSAALAAPKGAQAISVLRPNAEPATHELYRAIDPNIGAVGGPGGGILIVVFEHRILELSADPTIWAADGLKARLENAGYTVRDVSSLSAATTPITVSIEISAVSAEPGITETGHKDACAVTVKARINVVERQQSLFGRSFEGTHRQPARSCLQPPAIPLALRKALENLLNNAFPELAPVLVRATQREKQEKRRARGSRP